MADFTTAAAAGELIKLTPDGAVTKGILREGDGEECPKSAFVGVHYVGKFPEGSEKAGEVFDSSRRKGRIFQFAVGQGSVIQGWDVGVASMRCGELCTLTCTPPYAYGQSGAGGVIPPNATLEFEVELLGWRGMKPSKADSSASGGSGTRCSVA